MFKDNVMSLKQVGKLALSLQPEGLTSVAQYLQLSGAVLDSLKEHQLLDLVLDEIEKRNPNEICKMRSHSDRFIGVPKGLEAQDLNTELDRIRKASDLDMDATFTRLSYTKTLTDEIEMLPNDIYRISFRANINTLTSRVNERAGLFRMFCSNKSYTNLKNFSRTIALINFDPNFSHFEQFRESFVEHLTKILAQSKIRNANAQSVEDLALISKILKSETLKISIAKKLEKIIGLYKIPFEHLAEEKFVAKIFTLPESWLKTAEFDDIKIFDIWDEATREITEAEKLKITSADKILEAHIIAANLLNGDRNKVLTAVRR